jgi:hypothetical protein
MSNEELETEVVDAEDSNAVDANCPEGYTAITATAKLKDGGRVEATFYHDFKDSALAAIEAWGDAIVHAGFIRAAKIDAQSRMRSLLEAGKDPEEVADNMTTSWYPGAKNMATKDDLLAAFGKMSPDERADLLAKMAAQAGA